MILGVTGAGKSTLINSLLQLEGDKAAKVGRGRIVTTETRIYKEYIKVTKYHFCIW